MSDIDSLPQNPCYVSVKPDVAGYTSSKPKTRVDVGTKVKLHAQTQAPFYCVAEPFFWDPAHPVHFIMLQVSGFAPGEESTDSNTFKPSAECTSSLHQLM